MRKGILDKGLNKLVSKKLLVWGTGVCALFTNHINGDEFISLSIIYILSQGAVDAIVRYKHGDKLLP